LFKLPNRTPKSVADTINRSFLLCWSDISASCNVLRVAVEKLFVEQWGDIKGKSLSEKINKLKNHSEDSPERLQVCNLLNAIRFLGNDASHDDAMEERDLAVAFDFIERILNIAFDAKNDKLNTWASMVNDAKGSPIKPKF
jgi:hypothetical protein